MNYKMCKRVFLRLEYVSGSAVDESVLASAGLKRRLGQVEMAQ